MIHNPNCAYNVYMRRQVFVVWFIIFLAWAFYRAYFFYPEWVDELIVKPIVFVLPVLYAVLRVEKKGLKSLGLKLAPLSFFVDLYVGFILGVIFAIEGLVVNFVKYSKFSFVPILAVSQIGGWGSFFLLNLATSIWEEILGRGYLYQRLYKSGNDQLGSALSASFLFLLLHIPIMFTRLDLMGISLIIYPLSIFLLGVANSYILSLRRSLVLPVLIHLFWNMTVALYL